MDKNKISYIGVKAIIVNSDGEVLMTQEPTRFVGGGNGSCWGKSPMEKKKCHLKKFFDEIREELSGTFR